MKVFDAKTPWDAYLQMLQALIEGKSIAPVMTLIHDASQNLVMPFPHYPESIFWLLRETSDFVEGERAPGGLMMRYDTRRHRYFKGGGFIDWAWKERTGKTLDLDEVDESFLSTSVTARHQGDQQIQYALKVLMDNPGSDKAVLTFFDWRKQLREYICRKQGVFKFEDDAIHQRIPCGIAWHIVTDKDAIHSHVMFRNNEFLPHMICDLYRFAEIPRYIGTHLNKPVGHYHFMSSFMRQVFFSDWKERALAIVDYYSNRDPMPLGYEDLSPTKEGMVGYKAEHAKADWEMKEYAELLSRIGAFESAEKAIKLIKLPYYREWATCMLLAETMFNYYRLQELQRNGMSTPAIRRANDYICGGEQNRPFEVWNRLRSAYRPHAAVQLLRHYWAAEDLESMHLVCDGLNAEDVSPICAAAFRRSVKTKDIPYLMKRFGVSEVCQLAAGITDKLYKVAHPNPKNVELSEDDINDEDNNVELEPEQIVQCDLPLNGLNVFQASKEDVEAIQRVAAEDKFYASEVIAEQGCKFIQDWLSKKNYHLVAVELDGSIIGFVTGAVLSGTSRLSLLHLFVSEQFASIELFDRVLSAVEKLRDSLGCKSVGTIIKRLKDGDPDNLHYSNYELWETTMKQRGWKLGTESHRQGNFEWRL